MKNPVNIWDRLYNRIYKNYFREKYKITKVFQDMKVEGCILDPDTKSMVNLTLTYYDPNLKQTIKLTKFIRVN